MPVSMVIDSPGGSFTFLPREMPLISRRIDARRRSDNDPGRRIVTIRLTGFFKGAQHSDVVARYQQLITVLNSNEGEFTYDDGAVVILNSKRVFFDNYSEPSDWKQYTGEYEIEMHYFDSANNTTPITASYSSAGGTYFFEPVPLWSTQFHPNRQDFKGPRVTPSGSVIAREAIINLQGFVEVANHTALAADLQNLKDALQFDGTLNYGNWSNSVRVVETSIPPVFPTDYYEYGVSFGYLLDSSIRRFSSKRSYSRIHNFPVIKNKPFCGVRSIQTFPPSGQTVSYDFEIQSDNIVAARTLLENEVALVISPGGIELEGGAENWDDSTHTITLSFKKYHDTPILANLIGS